MTDLPMTDESFPRPLSPAIIGDDRAGASAGQAAPNREPAGAPARPDDLQAIFDVPVKVQAILGRSRMDMGKLLRLKAGDVVDLDRRVGEPVDLFINDRLVARGEVVLIDSALGVTLTEIVRQDR